MRRKPLELSISLSLLIKSEYWMAHAVMITWWNQDSNTKLHISSLYTRTSNIVYVYSCLPRSLFSLFRKILNAVNTILFNLNTQVTMEWSHSNSSSTSMKYFQFKLSIQWGKKDSTSPFLFQQEEMCFPPFHRNKQMPSFENLELLQNMSIICEILKDKILCHMNTLSFCLSLLTFLRN